MGGYRVQRLGDGLGQLVGDAIPLRGQRRGVLRYRLLQPRPGPGCHSHDLVLGATAILIDCMPAPPPPLPCPHPSCCTVYKPAFTYMLCFKAQPAPPQPSPTCTASTPRPSMRPMCWARSGMAHRRVLRKRTLWGRSRRQWQWQREGLGV